MFQGQNEDQDTVFVW